MARSYELQIQQLYVAYFNRPADHAGMQFWNAVVDAAEGDTGAVSAAFAASDEYKREYADKSTAEVVSTVYRNIFGRAPDSAGLDFWARGLQAGLFSVDHAVTTIKDGAQGADRIVFDNKVNASAVFTRSLDTAQEQAGYNGADANNRAKVWLNGISSDVTLAQAILKGVIDQTVATVISGIKPPTPTPIVMPVPQPDPTPTPQPTPQPVPAPDPVPTPAPSPEPAVAPGTELSVNDDNIVLTADDDILLADNDAATGMLTLNGNDRVDGGDGSDTIIVTSMRGGVVLGASLAVRNIENLSIANADAAIDANLSGWAGLERIAVEQYGDGAVSIITGGNVERIKLAGGSRITLLDSAPEHRLASVSLRGHGGQALIESDALTSLSLSRASGSVTVKASVAHALDLWLDDVNAAAGATVAPVVVKDLTATRVDIAAFGAASAITLATDAASAIHIDGDQILSITLDDAGEHGATIATITSVNSAGVIVEGALGNGAAFTGGDGADQVTLGASTRAIDMGAGDDSVTLNRVLGAGAAIAGGEGYDTLYSSAEVAAAVKSTSNVTITGFEKLVLGAASGATALQINAARVGNPQDISLDGNQIGGNGLEISNLRNQATVELTQASSGVTRLFVGSAATSAGKALNIALNGETNLVNSGTLRVGYAETVNIVTTTSGAHAPAAASTLALYGNTTVTTVNLFGNHGIDFTGSSIASLDALDASGVWADGAAGAVTFVSSATAKSMNIATGQGNDVIDLRSVTGTSAGSTVNTGIGDDIVYGGAGDDVIDLGAGRDIVYSSTGADVITLGAGHDVYVLQSAPHSSAAMPSTIADFQANTMAAGVTAAAVANGATTAVADLNGDTIALKVGALATAGIAVRVVDGEAAALGFLSSTAANSDAHTTGIALDGMTGKLYIDLDADGSLDAVIVLTGVAAITEAAFVVTH